MISSTMRVMEINDGDEHGTNKYNTHTYTHTQKHKIAQVPREFTFYMIVQRWHFSSLIHPYLLSSLTFISSALTSISDLIFLCTLYIVDICQKSHLEQPSVKSPFHHFIYSVIKLNSVNKIFSMFFIQCIFKLSLLIKIHKDFLCVWYLDLISPSSFFFLQPIRHTTNYEFYLRTLYRLHFVIN